MWIERSEDNIIWQEVHIINTIDLQIKHKRIFTTKSAKASLDSNSIHRYSVIKTRISQKILLQCQRNISKIASDDLFKLCISVKSKQSRH